MDIKKESPEGQIVLVLWRTLIAMAGPIADHYRWILTGIAAILAVIVGNLQSIQSVIQEGFLKASMILLVISLALASFAYLLSIALRFRNEVTQKIEDVLKTQSGQSVLSQLQEDPATLRAAISKPFFGPIGWLMRRGYDKGMVDPFASEKGSIKLILWQAYAMWISMILAAASFFVMAIGIE